MLLACLRLVTQGTQLSLSPFTKGTCPEQRKRGQTHFSLFTSFSYLEGLDMCSISDNSFHEAEVIFMMSRHARTRWFQKRNGVHILRIMNKLFREGEQMGGFCKSLSKSGQIVLVELWIFVCFQNARYQGMVIFRFTSESIDFPRGYWYAFCINYQQGLCYLQELAWPLGEMNG